MARNDHRKAATARAAAQAGDTETLRAALTEERRGYVVRALPERIKGVDAQLRALPSAPAQPKAAKTVAAKAAKTVAAKAEGAPRGSAKSQVPAPGADDASAPDDAAADGGDKPGQA